MDLIGNISMGCYLTKYKYHLSSSSSSSSSRNSLAKPSRESLGSATSERASVATTRASRSSLKAEPKTCPVCDVLIAEEKNEKNHGSWWSLTSSQKSKVDIGKDSEVDISDPELSRASVTTLEDEKTAENASWSTRVLGGLRGLSAKRSKSKERLSVKGEARALDL
ncbi:UNVERIFIED_CONTAM: hypothetical protein HDU68_000466 [Siphonaria sp. JEL0065]|nr:hypothetical protein HDU68_000466 [Siphonaria sp. JEL0065]